MCPIGTGTVLRREEDSSSSTLGRGGMRNRYLIVIKYHPNIAKDSARPKFNLAPPRIVDLGPVLPTGYTIA